MSIHLLKQYLYEQLLLFGDHAGCPSGLRDSRHIDAFQAKMIQNEGWDDHLSYSWFCH